MEANELARGGISVVEFPEDLRRSVRVYLGMRYMGCRDLELIGRAIGWLVSETLPRGSVARVRKLADKINRSQCKIVRGIQRRGLPLTALAYTENDVFVRCRKCGSYRAAVPCHKCAVVWNWRDDPEDDEELDQPLTEPDFPTDAAPGSRAKMDLMEQRLALGQSCFHPNDKRLTFEYTTPRPDTVSLYGLEPDWDND
jgi:hypothetical protein